MGNWFFVAIAMLVAFIASGDRLAYGVFVVPVSEAFNLTRSQAVLPVSVAMAVWGVSQPFIGSMLDTYGPRRIILAGLALMSLGFLASAVSQNLVQLMLGYGLFVGIASGGLATAAFGLLISRRFGQQQRGRAIGFALAGIPLGTLAFAPFISFMANSWNWRWAFVVMAAIVLLIGLPLGYLFLKEPRHVEGALAQNFKAGSLFNKDILRAIKSRAYLFLLLAYFGCGSSGQFLQAHLPAIARDHGFSPQVGALGLGMIGAGGAVGAMIGGWLSDRFGRFKVLIAGYLMRAAGFFMLAFFVSDTTSFYTIALVAGLPIFLTVTVTQTVVFEIFGTRIAGRMLGLIFVLHQVGSTLGPWVGGRLYESTDSYQLALLIGTGLLSFSALCVWLLQEFSKNMKPVEAIVETAPRAATS
ncbi:MAG: MFS transporter [Dehalococcoidia bacterium]|nr:MFS transporter [Dehalococcoidia bacterium]